MEERSTEWSEDEAWAAVASLSAWARRIEGLPSPAVAAALVALAEQAEALATRARFAVRGATAPTAEVIEAQRPRLLLVDDDVPTLDVLAELLASDFEVFTAREGLDGLRLARERDVDAIVTDLHMPGLSGLDVLGLLRVDATTADKPCLVLTADEDGEEKLAAFDLGAADYLEKPVAIDELVARVRQRIASARRLHVEKELQEVDELTRLPNRRALHRRAPRLCAEARAGGNPLSVAFVDADGLKEINDTFGHAAGDRAIRAVAEALRSSKRNEDFAVRLGGDEFAVVMPGTDREGAARWIERFRDELARRPIELDEAAILVRVSVGLAVLRETDVEWASVLDRADASLYEEKRSRPTRRTDPCRPMPWRIPNEAPEEPEGRASVLDLEAPFDRETSVELGPSRSVG